MNDNFTLVVEQIPATWRLLPVNGRKQPVDPISGAGLKAWTKSSFDARNFPFDSPHVKAVGVLAGPASGGLLVIDIDSESGQNLLENMTGQKLQDFPPTIACTSGRQGTQKRFYQVSDETIWAELRTAHLKDLDILWTGSQAVLCGMHPETGRYNWLDNSSPAECKVACAPNWLTTSLINTKSNKKASIQSKPVFDTPQTIPSLPGLPPHDNSNDINLARQALRKHDPSRFQNYKPWLDVGMSLRSVSDSLLEDWIQWSSRMSNFDEDECRRKWETFSDSHSYYERTGRHGLGLGTLLTIGSPDAIPTGNRDLIAAMNDKRTANNALLQLLRSWNNIRFNELKRRIEINGKILDKDPRYFYLQLAECAGVNVSRELAKDALVVVAQENPFNPVAEYLESVVQLASETEPVSDMEIASWFGLNYEDYISIELIRIHLRGCAVRGLSPGSKMDSVLILSGAMGLRKSSVIKALVPDVSWYDETTRMDIDNKDTLSAMNSTWIFELSEIEKLTATRESSALKAWVTRTTDKYVEKYETITTEHQRRTCLWGTTNAGTFLNDPTGSRRYWICFVEFPCDVNALVENRDRLWAYSLREAQQGLPSYLDPTDSLMIETNKRGGDATLVDPWQELLQKIVERFPSGTFLSTQVLFSMIDHSQYETHGFQRDGGTLASHNLHDARRLASGMNSIGWRSSRNSKERGYLKL